MLKKHFFFKIGCSLDTLATQAFPNLITKTIRKTLPSLRCERMHAIGRYLHICIDYHVPWNTCMTIGRKLNYLNKQWLSCRTMDNIHSGDPSPVTRNKQRSMRTLPRHGYWAPLQHNHLTFFEKERRFVYFLKM